MKVLSPSQFIKLREASGLTQQEVQTKYGVSDVVISRLENGRSNNPKHTTLERLSKAYGCDIADFYVEEKQALAYMVQKELYKRLESIKQLLAGSEGQIDEFTIELKLKNSPHRIVRQSGKIDE